MEPERKPTPGARIRYLDDPKAIRALAHPLRAKLLGLLREHGPSTATALADIVGESHGSTSYHLRQLFKHGLIEDVPQLGNGRDRWWQAAADHFDFAATGDSPEYGKAAAQLRARIVERDAGIVTRFVAAESSFSRAWQEAATFDNEVIHVTASEMVELRERLRSLLDSYRRDDPAMRPRGARRAYAVVRLVPWVSGERPRSRDGRR
jgi:DNA-binding transcriptional ArsR family regulator